VSQKPNNWSDHPSDPAVECVAPAPGRALPDLELDVPTSSERNGAPAVTGAERARRATAALALPSVGHVLDLTDVRHAATIDLAGAVAARKDALWMLRQAAALCAVAVEAQAGACRAMDRAARDRADATVDELTGALRRNAGFVALDHEIERARRAGTGLVIGFLDVDRLKHVNDTRGHAAGDDLLRAVVAALRSSLRSYDVVIRYGGDEFVYSLAGADLPAALARFHAMSGLLAHRVPGRSVSAGFSELRLMDDLDALIGRADRDLYARRAAVRS
jgi:diguanylate cyclase (GGDEF)-like protein